MGDAIQIEVDVDPLSDMEPIGDGYRRVRHRTCGSWLQIRRHSVTDVYSFKCPCCGEQGEVAAPMIDRIDFSAIRGDGVPVIIEVLPRRR